MIANNDSIEAYEIVKGNTIPSLFYNIVEMIDDLSAHIYTDTPGALTRFVYDDMTTQADETHGAIMYMLNKNFKLTE
jgi:hypothetical protein